MLEPSAAHLFATSPHLQCNVGPIRAWFTRPEGVVFQLAKSSRMTDRMAQWVVGPAFDAATTRFPTGTPLLFVIDLRLMTGRDPGVRAAFMSLAREAAERLRVAVVIPPLRSHQLYLSGLQTAAELVRPFGTVLEVTTGASDVLERFGLTAASE